MDLGEAGYLRERLNPQPGEMLYLHLSDLLIALNAMIPGHLSMVLDYGCGGSPYRPLFGNCTYHRADLSGGNNLDFEYGPDSKLPLELSGYDCILSTQVTRVLDEPFQSIDGPPPVVIRTPSLAPIWCGRCLWKVAVGRRQSSEAAWQSTETRGVRPMLCPQSCGGY